VSAVRAAERVVDVNVSQASQRIRELRVVAFLAA